MSAWRAALREVFVKHQSYLAAGNNACSARLRYVLAQNMVQVLKQCGDDLTREKVMRQAASIKNFSTEMMLPGIKVNRPG
jgi:hypothetical protein